MLIAHAFKLAVGTHSSNSINGLTGFGNIQGTAGGALFFTPSDREWQTAASCAVY